MARKSIYSGTDATMVTEHPAIDTDVWFCNIQVIRDLMTRASALIFVSQQG